MLGKKLLLTLAAATLASAPAAAATVTVAAVGGDFTNIADAIAATAPGDTIVVTDQGAYGAFAFSDRILVSDPPGALITATVIVEGGAGSEATMDGFVLDGVGNAIFLNGTGGVAGTLVLRNMQITNNTSHGILLNDGEDGTLVIEDSTISNNGENGITLFRNATVSITDSTLSDNGFGAGGHGSIFVDGALSNALGRVITLDNTTISGGLYGIRSFRRSEISLLNGSSISDAILDGLFLDGESMGSSIMVSDSSITGNGLRGMFLARGMELSMDNATVSSNGNDGIFLEDFASSGVQPVVAIADSTVTGNSGRGLFHNGKSNVDTVLTITGSTFAANGNRQISAEAVPGASAVLYTLVGNTVVDGSNGAESAIIAFTSAPGSLIATNFVDGGAVCIATNLGPFALHNNTLVNAGGAAVEVFNGGGFAIDIRNNVLAQSGDGLASGSGSGLESVLVDYNIFQTGGTPIAGAYSPGTNNIVTGSLEFAAPSATVGAGDYRLTSISPAVNAGDPTLVLAEDIEGFPYATPPDMGAFSFSGSPAHVPDWMLFQR